MDEIVDNQPLVIIDNDESENIETLDLTHPYLKYKELAGILYLDKTFGKKGKKYLYKCKPYDRTLPCLLIPYEVEIGFQKNFENKYILFEYTDISCKPLQGILKRTIGSVNINDEEHYFEYLLYGSYLQLTQTPIKSCVRNYTRIYNPSSIIDILYKYYKSKKVIHENIFTIDGNDCIEHDDAISICFDKETQLQKISIYISNVHVWFEEMDLWKLFNNESKTVYFPGSRRSMLPSIFTDNFCNLLKGQYRIVLCYNFYVNNDGEIVNVIIENVVVKIQNNYIYESEELLKQNDYLELLKISKQMDSNIINSYDVVKHWMIQVNKFIGSRFIDEKLNGIFLSSFEKSYEKILHEKINGYYTPHYSMDISSKYLQVTSPMRRFVDILNSMKINRGLFIKGENFYIQWLENFDKFNTKFMNIKHIEKKCEMIHMLREQPNFEKEFELKKVYDGLYTVIGLNRFIFNDDNVTKIKFIESRGKIKKILY